MTQMSPKDIVDSVTSFFDFARKHYIHANFAHARFPEEAHFEKTLTDFTGLSGIDRKQVHAAVSDSYDAYYLADFSIRETSFALQTRDTGTLRLACLGLSIDEDAIDPRAVFGALSAIREAASRLEIDPYSVIICQLLGIMSQQRRRLVEDFFFHPDSVKSLDKLGYELVEVTGASWFRRKAE